MAVFVCPTCRQEVRRDRREDAPHRPFCSDRCRMIDLAKWLAEEYRISRPLDPAPSLRPDETDPEAD